MLSNINSRKAQIFSWGKTKRTHNLQCFKGTTCIHTAILLLDLITVCEHVRNRPNSVQITGTKSWQH